MDQSYCPVLSAAIDYYDQTGQSVTPAAVARALGQKQSSTANRLRQLSDCEWLAVAEEGYRPTVTGRELLELDVSLGTGE